MRDLFLEGLIFGGKFEFQNLALQLEVNLPFLLYFSLYFQVQAAGGLIFGGTIQRRVFCVTGLGGLYLEGLIHGGAYFPNFTVTCLHH